MNHKKSHAAMSAELHQDIHEVPILFCFQNCVSTWLLLPLLISESLFRISLTNTDKNKWQNFCCQSLGGQILGSKSLKLGLATHP